jgi:hypothetical protein
MEPLGVTEAQPGTATLIVPADLVADLRVCTYGELRYIAEAATDAYETPSHSRHHEHYQEYRGRALAACALLDDLGWLSSIGAPTAVRVDLVRHGPVLLPVIVAALGDARHALEEDVEARRQKNARKCQAIIQRTQALLALTALAFGQVAAISRAGARDCRGQ